MADTPWHPVTPHITDPDLITVSDGQCAPGTPGASGLAGQAAGPLAPSFFEAHRVAVIVAIVIFLVVVVMIYMYFTRSSDSSGDVNAKSDTSEGGANEPTAGADKAATDTELADIQKLAAQRRAA